MKFNSFEKYYSIFFYWITRWREGWVVIHGKIEMNMAGLRLIILQIRSYTQRSRYVTATKFVARTVVT